MKIRVIAMLLLGLCAGRANSQAEVGKVSPDRFAFGKVHAGSLVEGSFTVLAAPRADGKVIFQVTPPPFVKVLGKDTDIWKVGRDFQRGNVDFAVDTSKAGELTGRIAVQLNATTVQVPVSASVRPQRAGLLRLLIVETPFHKYSTSDAGHFRPWTDLVADSPWDVHYLLANRDQPVLRDLKLADFGAVLLGPEGVYWETPADVKRVRKYVVEGGTVIVLANYFFRGTVEKANTLLKGYGVALADTETHGEQVTLEKPNIDSQLVKAGIDKVTFFRASPITVTDPLRGRVLVKAVQVGQAGDGFVAATNVGHGKIIVISQSLWWDWITPRRDPHGGNARLLRWILTGAHQRSQRLLTLKEPLSAAQITTCWNRLASDDADEASEAGYWLTRAPGANRLTVPFLKKHLSPDAPPNAVHLKRLLAGLDDESFQAREKAQRELTEMGDLAAAALQKTLQQTSSLEVHRRIKGILSKLPSPAPDKRRCLRAIDVLEQLATPEAKELLGTLSQGAPGTRVTTTAQAALERLATPSAPD